MSKQLRSIFAGLFGAFAMFAVSAGAADAAPLQGASNLQKSVAQPAAAANLVEKTRYGRGFYFSFGVGPYYRPYGYWPYRSYYAPRYYRPRYYRPRYYGYRYRRAYPYYGVRVYRYRRRW
jgi:hypothetical protein